MTDPVLSLDIGSFSLVSRNQEVNHGIHGRYRVVLYGAASDFGQANPRKNGIGILIEPKDGARGAVVCDGLGQEPARCEWPTARQLALHKSIVNMPWAEFKATVNRSDNKRFKL